MMKRFAVCLVALSLALLLCPDALAKEIQGKCGMGRDYWLYVPDTIDPDKTYTLVVGVHGAGGKGKGAAGHAGWVNDHDVIVLGPSYPHAGFQYLQKDSDKQTIDLFKTLRREYKLYDKLFIAGFSGGSQYAHRFAMKYPELVSGCAAHSGGTWATGDYPRGEKPNPKAKGVLFVISCGENDTKKSFNEAPFGRLDWAEKYEQLLEKGGFTYDAQYWPGVGHKYASGARQQSVDCFTASTQLLPELAGEADQVKQLIERQEYDDAWKIIRTRQRLATRNNEGIIGRVLEQYLASLEPSIASIDRWTKLKVAQAVNDHEDDDARALALRKLKAAYKGLPKTTEALEAELDKLR